MLWNQRYYISHSDITVTNKEVIENSLKIIKEKYTDKLFMYDNISTIDSTFEIRKIKPDVVIDHIGLIEYQKMIVGI